jgi:hypothetical protein
MAKNLTTQKAIASAADGATAAPAPPGDHPDASSGMPDRSNKPDAGVRASARRVFVQAKHLRALRS